MRTSSLVFNVTQRLLYTKWRDPGEEPKLYLFGQLKRITKQWLDTCLVCKGGTYPAQLMYQELADMACNRITAAITRQFLGTRPIKALLDPYNHTGSTSHVRFNTSRTDRWDTSGPPPKNHVNWVVYDSDWEAEFCRVAESHPKVIAYTKNHNLGLEVPYRYGSETRKYIPDFIVLVDDGHGPDDPLRLVVEIKGYRREDAKEKKSTMDTYWVPGVNNLGTYGRWAFAEFTEVYQIESDFEAKVKGELDKMIERSVAGVLNKNDGPGHRFDSEPGIGMLPDGTLNLVTPEKLRARQLLNRLLAMSKEEGRVCPQPSFWNRLWELLPDRKRVGAGWLPDPPLILAAWSESSDDAKRNRFEYHLDWAYEHGAIDAVADLLSSMKPEDWHTEQ
jgi:hypothetical protein